jgi:multidrug efflux pump subunit AcrB
MIRLLKFRYIITALSVALLFAALWYAVNFMNFVLFPSSAADQLYILAELPMGTSLQATSNKVKEIEELVSNLPAGEVESFVTRIGNHGYFNSGENENWAILSISLTPFGERSRNAEQIVEELRKNANGLTGFEKTTCIVDAGGPPVGRPITLRIVSSDDKMRTQLADSVTAFLTTIEGVKDIDRDDKPGKEQVEIKVNYDQLARLGLSVADIAQNVRIAFDGEVVSSVRYGDEDVDFRVLLQERARTGAEYLKRLLIPNRQGRLIPLRDVAWLKTGPGPSNFYHFDGERTITVTADIVKGTTTPLLATQAVYDHFDLDKNWPGMRFVVGGEAEETQKSMVSLAIAFITAVIAIYFLLILLFNSPLQPLLVLSAIPFGIIGVIAAFVLHSQSLGFMAMMGVIGLSGVVINDSLVMVNHINNLRKQRPGDRLIKIVAKGSSDRLRAVIMTSLTTISGLLPLAYGIGGSEPFMAPMALALGYGLLFATPVTLVLLPSLYMISNDIRIVLSRIAEFVKSLFIHQQEQAA